MSLGLALLGSDAYASTLPQIVGAAGHTPPEGCGGLSGYEDFIKAVERGEDDDEDAKLIQQGRGNGWKPFVTIDALNNRLTGRRS